MIKTTLKITGLAILALVLAGIVYEQLGERQDRKKFAQIGRSVDIGGRTLNIFCSGEGSPSVILETGGSGPGYIWTPVQPQIAQFTHTCWYDRAGEGWSDPSPVPRTSAAIADDLHALLHAAGVPPPYVLVGASAGGFHVRVFAGKYPDEVAGVILVDSSHPDQYGYEPRSMKARASRLPKFVRTLIARLAPTAARIGLVRISQSSPRRDPPPGMTVEQWACLQFLQNQPKSFVANVDGTMHFELSLAQVRASGNLGDRPLIVLTAGEPFTSPLPAEAGELRAFHDIWVHQLQPQLARLSSRGRQVIVPNSGHGIASEAPNVFVDAVRDVVSEVQTAQRKF